MRVGHVVRRAGLLALSAGLLAGCGSGDHEDLSAFVAQVQSRKAPPIEAMPQVASYQPYAYTAAGRRSPFQPPAPDRARSNSGIRPDTNRPLDPLEQFPLDALSLVGTLTSGGTTYALIRAPDGVVHRVAPGSHLGRNYGEIRHVDPSGVSIVEIVSDGNGGYVKRDTALAPSTDRTP